MKKLNEITFEKVSKERIRKEIVDLTILNVMAIGLAMLVHIGKIQTAAIALTIFDVFLIASIITFSKEPK